MALADTQYQNATAALYQNATQFSMVPDWDPGNANDSFGQLTEWDRLVIGDNVMPGVASVDGDKDAKIDLKVTQGTDGANATHLGMANAPISVRLKMWTVQQLEDYRRILPHLVARTGKARPDPVSVYHPALAMMGICSLFVKSVGLPRVTSPGGPVEVMIRFLEYLPPNKKGGGAVTFKGDQSLANVKRANARRPTQPSPKETENHP